MGAGATHVPLPRLGQGSDSQGPVEEVPSYALHSDIAPPAGRIYLQPPDVKPCLRCGSRGPGVGWEGRAQGGRRTHQLLAEQSRGLNSPPPRLCALGWLGHDG